MTESEELIQLRTVALLAQAVVDAHDRQIFPEIRDIRPSLDDLRQALTRIGKPADSACEVKKTPANEQSEAGPDEAGSPS